MTPAKIDLPALRTAEFAFVVAACRWPGGPPEYENLRDLAGRVADWQRVAEIVARHRVAGLVAANAKAAGLVMGSPAEQSISDWARQDAAQELLLFRETRRMVGLLQADNIDVRVLKGVATAIAVFGRLGVRFSTDIDLLVPQDKALSAARVLEQAGFVRAAPAASASPRDMRRFLSRNKDFVYRHPDTGVLIELHWRLFQNRWVLPLPRDLAPAWLDFAGVSLPVLPADLALLFLCAHGGEHGWARLKWLADLGALLRDKPEQADFLIGLARNRKMIRLVGPGMLIAAKLFGTPLPEYAARMFHQRRRFRWITRIAWNSLVGDENGVELEDLGLAAAKKNLGHYLVSSDPRQWLAELRYDWTDKSRAADAPPRWLAAISKLYRLVTRLPGS